MSDITIRDLTLEEASLAGDFFHRWWRPEHVFYTKPALLKWLYHDNPLARTCSQGLTFKAAFRNNDIVGVFAYFPFPLNRYGHRSVGVNLSAWWVHPEHRRGSLGARLLNSLQHSMGFEACVSGMNTPIAETLYARMGWVVCRCIPRWLFVLDAVRFRGLLASSDTERPLRESPLRVDTSIDEADVDVRTLSDLSSLGSLGWDKTFWNAIAPGYTGPARESAYLKWRYQDIPVFKYETAMALRREELGGLIVYRFETVRDAGGLVVRIVDAIAEPWAMQPLLRHAVAHARSREAVMVDCFSTLATHARGLEQAGFINAVDGSGERYWAPHLFQPVDHERRRLNSAWWIRDIDLTQPAARNDFLLMKGDYEFDRPN